VTARPSTSTRPWVGAIRPAAICSSVDLPHPDGPTIDRNSPCLTEKLMSASATARGSPAVPNDFPMPSSARQIFALSSAGGGSLVRNAVTRVANISTIAASPCGAARGARRTRSSSRGATAYAGRRRSTRASRPLSMKPRTSSRQKPKSRIIICHAAVWVTWCRIGLSVLGCKRKPSRPIARIGWSSAQRSSGSVRR